MERILKNELKTKLYKFEKAHDLTPTQKKIKFERARRLARLHKCGEFPNIVFSDERNFLI